MITTEGNPGKVTDTSWDDMIHNDHLSKSRADSSKNTGTFTHAGTMLGQRRRQWASIVPALDERPVFCWRSEVRPCKPKGSNFSLEKWKLLPFGFEWLDHCSAKPKDCNFLLENKHLLPFDFKRRMRLSAKAVTDRRMRRL